MFTASTLGVLTGLILGLTGAGGGILAVPALIIGLGFDMTTAAPVALMAVGMASLVGALDGLRKHQVRYKAAFLMAVAGALFSSVGVALAHALPEKILTTLFALIMLLIAARMYRDATGKTLSVQIQHDKPCKLNPLTGRFQWTRRCAATLTFIGATTGVCAGMLGVGGGFIIVPAFKRFTDIPVHGIVATSLMLITLISLSAATGSMLQGIVIPVLGWVFVGAAVAGMLAGRSIAARIPGRILQLAFASITLIVAAVLLTHTWIASLTAYAA